MSFLLNHLIEHWGGRFDLSRPPLGFGFKSCTKYVLNCNKQIFDLDIHHSIVNNGYPPLLHYATHSLPCVIIASRMHVDSIGHYYWVWHLIRPQFKTCYPFSSFLESPKPNFCAKIWLGSPSWRCPWGLLRNLIESLIVCFILFMKFNNWFSYKDFLKNGQK